MKIKIVYKEEKGSQLSGQSAHIAGPGGSRLCCYSDVKGKLCWGSN